MTIKRFSFGSALFILVLIVCSLPVGCGPVLSPQARQTINQTKEDAETAKAKLQAQAQEAAAKLKVQSDLAIQAAKAKAALNKLNGETDPGHHPFAAINNLVVKFRPWLIGITIVSFVCWAVEFGLSFTSFTFLSFLAPVFRWVSILSLAALIALPFLPISLICVGVALVGLIVYELIKDKGNVAQAETDTETLLLDLDPKKAAPATQTASSASAVVKVSTTTPAAPAATASPAAAV